jgi:glycine/D-amino acid oxidase-like deaminating enzyme
VTAARPEQPWRTDPAAISFWLEDCGDDLAPRPALPGDRTVDVAILGGGFSGLWTAYHLLRARPDLEIAIVEREICGFGASGRNGGWCSPRFPVDAHALVARYGEATARAVMHAIADAVEDVGRVCEREGIDAHYRTTGLLSIARSEAQLAGLAAALATYQRLGMAEGARLLNKEQALARVHATRVHGGLHAPTGATVHPGRLVRGLARTVERLGATIFEKTAVTDIREGEDAALVTAAGEVRARIAVVAAGEAYLSELPAFRRTLLPMSSMIVLTEPLTRAQWESVGWRGGESLSSLVHTKNYLTRTADGRILYGSRGAPYHFGSAMSEAAVRVR